MSNLSPLHDITSAAGAVFADEAGWSMPQRFAGTAAEYRCARERAALFDRSHHGKVQVTGPDAATFLQNLCTNDIKALKPGAGCEAFLTTAKAKIVAHLFVLRLIGEEPRFWLDAGPGRGSAVLKHLDHYLISEQVELTDSTADLAQLHLAGIQTRDVLERALAEKMSPDTFSAPHSVLGVLGYDIFCPRSDAALIWNKLTAAGAAPAGGETYDILRVEAGMPLFGADMDEERFVVEVGRTRQAICYTKGCYLGQEPIVMARDRGHVNRLLLGLRIEGAPDVPVGARVLRDGAEVGAVTSAVVSPRLGSIALAYLRRGTWDPGTAVQVEAGGALCMASVVSLPFEGAGAGGA